MAQPPPSTQTVRDALAPFGDLRPQPIAEWTGEVELHPSLVRFYAEVGPYGEDEPEGPGGLWISTFGNDFVLPALKRLWERQAGYRWHGNSGERLADWPDAWLVVADQGGDPFMLDQSNGTILFALHGTGEWNTVPFCADVFILALILGTIGRLCAEAGEDLADEDCVIRPSWQAALRERLAAVVGGEEGNRIASLLEW